MDLSDIAPPSKIKITKKKEKPRRRSGATDRKRKNRSSVDSDGSTQSENNYDNTAETTDSPIEYQTHRIKFNTNYNENLDYLNRLNYHDPEVFFYLLIPL